MTGRGASWVLGTGHQGSYIVIKEDHSHFETTGYYTGAFSHPPSTQRLNFSCVVLQESVYQSHCLCGCVAQRRNSSPQDPPGMPVNYPAPNTAPVS